ncbi:MAG: CrcB family protein [Pirellulales bacterium]|nr:CrcB family protein [Pirellulales bacterium]
MLQKLLLIALAGGLGTLARYGLSGAVQNWVGRDFPWGTAVVNLLGCFTFGVVWASMEGRWAASGETRALVLVGFMGAFTTFSTFVFETGAFLQDSQWALALGNVALQNIVGVIALLLGMAVGNLL